MNLKYKESMNETLELPNRWVKTTLEVISQITLGRSPPSSMYNKIKKGMTFYQGKADFGDLHPTPRVWCEQPQTFAEKDDILMSVRAPVGSLNLSTETCGIGRGLAAIKLGHMSTMYVFYQLQHMENQIAQMGTGTTFKAITGNQVRTIPIIIAPLPEQHRIVSKIESIFAQIDACKIRLERLQTKSASGSLAQLKSSVLKQAFEGKLVPQDPNDESASVLLRKIDQTIELETEGLSQGWTKTKIQNICELIGGGTPSRKISEYFGGNMVWLTPTEIPKERIVKISESRECITELGLQRSSAKVIPAESVLLTSRASIGFVAIAGVPVTTNQGFASFVPSDVIFNYFLAYWLWANKGLLLEKATGTTFKEIPKSAIKQLEINIPPLPEQHRIVAKIESIFARIDARYRALVSATTLNLLYKIQYSPG